MTATKTAGGGGSPTAGRAAKAGAATAAAGTGAAGGRAATPGGSSSGGSSPASPTRAAAAAAAKGTAAGGGKATAAGGAAAAAAKEGGGKEGGGKEGGEQQQQQQQDAAGVQDLSNADVVTKYRTAADTVNAALKKVLAECVPGADAYELCKLGDNTITEACTKVYNKKENGRKVEKGIAFPTCISVNEICGHYSPMEGGEEGTVMNRKLQQGDVVKVDMGCHVDGYICVAAYTVVCDAALPAELAAEVPSAAAAAPAAPPGAGAAAAGSSSSGTKSNSTAAAAGSAPASAAPPAAGAAAGTKSNSTAAAAAEDDKKKKADATNTTGTAAATTNSTTTTTSATTGGSTRVQAITGRKADVIKGCWAAAEACLRLVKVGHKSGDITKIIETAAKQFNCVPLQGVSSHQLKRYVIEGSKCFANAPPGPGDEKPEEFEFEANEVYGVDIVLSTGEGKPRDGALKPTVYKRAVDRTYILKSQLGRHFMSEVQSKYPTLPFSLRALGDDRAIRVGVAEAMRHDLLHPYPVMTEKPGEYVAQFKFTLLLLPTGTKKVTGLPLFYEKELHSEHSVEDENLKVLLSTPVNPKKHKKKKTEKKDSSSSCGTAAEETSS